MMTSRLHRPIQPRRVAAATQSGAALLTAMVIVTLVTTVAASMLWQQWRSVQVEAAERSLVQSQWMLVGALDYGRAILRGDDDKVDHLGEPWALGLAETRISSLLAADKDNTDDAPDAFLSGRLVDASARYNLYNLFQKSSTTGLPHELDADQVVVLKQLCQYASLSASMADALALALQRALWAADATDNAAVLAKMGGPSAVKQAPLIPQTLDQLVWLGIDAGTIERLRPFITLLPEDVLPSTNVNLNTAPREVIASVVPNIDLGRAERLVQLRQRTPFSDINDALKALNLPAGQTPPPGVDIKSDAFEVQGRLRLENRVLSQNYLVMRQNKNITVLLEERVSGVQSAGSN